MSHLKNILFNFYSVIRKHKLLLLSLFIIQLVFIILMVLVNVKYQTALAANIQNIIQPLETANYDENAIKAGMPFLQDVARLAANYQQMLENLQKLVLFQLLVFFTVGLLSWLLTHLLFGKEPLLKLWPQLVLRSAVFIVPTLIIDYLIVNIALKQAAAGGTYTSLYAAVAFTAVAWYFMVVCLALPVLPLKKSIVRAFSIGIKKIHYTLGALLLNVLVIGLLVYLASLSVNWAFWSMVLTAAALVAAFVLARVFFVAVVREISS
ncbi:hypothetical protein HY497_00480 [Candidatus Woesearchaeota archaeon]|nr:hypothetical protein [Candidatus Woesearchaeota archaeon]